MSSLTARDEAIIKLFKDYHHLLQEYTDIQYLKGEALHKTRGDTDLLFDKYRINIADKYKDSFEIRYVQNDGCLKLIDLDDVRLIEDLFDATLERLENGVYSFRFNIKYHRE